MFLSFDSLPHNSSADRTCSSKGESLCDYTWQSGKSGDKNSLPTKRRLQVNTALWIKYMERILSCKQANTLMYTNAGKCKDKTQSWFMCLARTNSENKQTNPPTHAHPCWPFASMTNSADIPHSGSAWVLFGLAEREQKPFSPCACMAHVRLLLGCS